MNEGQGQIELRGPCGGGVQDHHDATDAKSGKRGLSWEGGAFTILETEGIPADHEHQPPNEGAFEPRNLLLIEIEEAREEGEGCQQTKPNCPAEILFRRRCFVLHLLYISQSVEPQTVIWNFFTLQLPKMVR